MTQAGRPKDMSTQTVKRKRQIEPQAVRRQQLIDAAIECIASHGIADTTLARVTRTAGLSIGMVNLHFNSKEELFAAALRFMVSEHEEIWSSGLANPEASALPKRLLIIADAHFLPAVCDRTRLSAWYAFFGEAKSRAFYLGVADDADNARKSEILRICSSVAIEGGYDCDPQLVALTLEAMFDGLWLNMLLYPEEFSPQRAKLQIRQFLACIFPRHHWT